MLYQCFVLSVSKLNAILNFDEVSQLPYEVSQLPYEVSQSLHEVGQLL